MTEFSRRRWLIAMGGTAASIAGCLSGDDESAANPSNDDPSTPPITKTPTQTGTQAGDSTPTGTDSPEQTGTEPVGTAVAGWPQTLATSGNTAAVPDQSPPVSNLSKKWIADSADEAAVADEQAVYAVTSNEDSPDILRAIARTDGTVLWKTEIDDIVDGTVAVSDGTLFVGDRNRYRALGVESGTTRWTHSTHGEQAVVADGRVYIQESNDNETITALSTSDGSVEWRTSVVSDDSRGVRTPHAVANGTVYLGIETRSGDGPPTVKALDTETGEVEWKKEIKGVYPQMVATSDTVFASTEKRLFALEPATGEVRWNKFEEQTQMGQVSTIFVPAVHAGIAYTTVGNALQAIDTQTGETQWKNKEITERVKYAGGYLYSARHSRVNVVDAETGEQVTEYEHPDDGDLRGEMLPVNDHLLLRLERTHENDAGEWVDTSSVIALDGDH